MTILDICAMLSAIELLIQIAGYVMVVLIMLPFAFALGHSTV